MVKETKKTTKIVNSLVFFNEEHKRLVIKNTNNNALMTPQDKAHLQQFDEFLDKALANGKEPNSKGFVETEQKK